jgi:hypothetical protein
MVIASLTSWMPETSLPGYIAVECCGGVSREECVAAFPDDFHWLLLAGEISSAVPTWLRVLHEPPYELDLVPLYLCACL